MPMDPRESNDILTIAKWLDELERSTFQFNVFPAFTTAPHGRVVPLSEPPIEDGLTYSIKRLFQIFAGNMADKRPTDSQLAQVRTAESSCTVIL